MHKKIKNQRKSLKRQFKRTLTVKEGVTAYKPTPLSTAHWYRKLNQMLFNNKLSGCEIQIRKLHNDWGRCVAD